MNRGRLVLLILGIPGLLGYGTLVSAQWQAGRSLTEYVALQKRHPPDSLNRPTSDVRTRKESTLARAARYAPDDPETAYQRALLKMVLAESASLAPSGPPGAGAASPGPALQNLLREALRSTNQAIARNPGQADYHFVKAIILQNLQWDLLGSEVDPEGKVVAHELRTAHWLNPFQPSLHFKIGSFWLALGDRVEAKRAFTVALKDSNRYARPVLDLLWSSTADVAEMKTLIGEDPLARAVLGDFLWTNGFKREAEGEYAEAERCRPMAFRVGELLVKQHFRTGRFESARAVLGTMLDNPQNLSTNQLARARYFQGQSYYLEKRYQDAISGFEDALRLEPGLYYAHRALGRVYSEVGDLDRAIARFRFVLDKTGNTLPPRDAAELHIELAGVYEKKNLYIEALHQYLRATQLDPANRVAQERAVKLGREHL